MTHTTVLAPIVSALVKAEDVLGAKRVWRTSDSANRQQCMFLDKYFTKQNELKLYTPAELKNWISWVASELNAILSKEGFDIKLDDFDPDTFGVVSILDVLVEWLAAGEEADIVSASGEAYPGVFLESSQEVDGKYVALFGVHKAKCHPHPVVRLTTKSGDGVCMTIADEEASGLKLAELIDGIRETMKIDQESWYGGVRFPMVDLDQEVDISWLLGLQTNQENTDRKAMICQAKQQTKFKMNQFGARVKSAVAMAIALESCAVPNDLIIDRPFYLWIEREGATTPVMYAYIDQDSWKNPGDMKDM